MPPLAAHHLAIVVGDLAGCEKFYREVLELPFLEHQRDAKGEIRSAWFRVGELILMLEKGPRAQNSGGFHLFSFKIHVKDRVPWKEKLQRAKVHITNESDFSLYFADPEGNRLALSHYPTRAQAV